MNLWEVVAGCVEEEEGKKGRGGGKLKGTLPGRRAPWTIVTGGKEVGLGELVGKGRAAPRRGKEGR